MPSPLQTRFQACLIFLRFFSLSWLLQQKTMTTIENDIVAGDLPLWLRRNFYDSFLPIATDIFAFLVKRASELSTRPEVK